MVVENYKNRKRKLPQGLAKSVWSTAKKNFETNKEKLAIMSPEEIYCYAYLHGYEGAWNTYEDEAEEVDKAYGKRNPDAN